MEFTIGLSGIHKGAGAELNQTIHEKTKDHSLISIITKFQCAWIKIDKEVILKIEKITENV